MPQQQQQHMQFSGSDEERSLQFWHEMVQSSVECELCNEPYGDEPDHIPRLLSCGHTFCQVRSHALCSVLSMC